MIRGSKRKFNDHVCVNADIACNIHNRFDVEVIDVNTGEVKQRAQAENVICNALWTELFTPTRYFNYIHYGTGAGTPAATDTGLFAFLGCGDIAIADISFSYDDANGVASVTKKVQLSETTAVGATLTEVGIGYSTGASNLVTHAMLKDMNGNQISIAKTATDIINIYATVFVHWNVAQYDNGYVKFVIGARPSKRESTSWYSSTFLEWLWGDGFPSNYPNYVYLLTGTDPFTHVDTNVGIADNYTTFSTSHDVSNKKTTFTVARLPVGANNLANGIKSIVIGGHASVASGDSYPRHGGGGGIHCIVGGAWYAGSTITGEAIATGDGVTKDFKTKFPLLSSGVVKVNGVEASGVTVDLNKPRNIADFGRNFELISSKHENGNATQMLPSVSDVCSMYAYTFAGFFDMIYYNPYYASGITSYKLYGERATVQVSLDKITWVTLSTGGAFGNTISVPTAYKNYPYWRVTCPAGTTSTDIRGIGSMIAGITSENNIHFDAAPASGAVITSDYVTKVIAKDTDHVFDLTATIYLGEKIT